ncbi:MAG: ATP-binding cassette domain-containing protein [Solobacterium sp.]|nr:ATP-binding cassette domain-containing protein [Solobacterium sp.]
MLELKHVHKTFNANTINERKALIDIQLEMKEGDFITVIGGNGAGKSTMLNAIAGVWPIDSGSIQIADENVTGLPDYKRAHLIGRVFQDPMLGSAPTMQIDENLALAARRGKTRSLKWGVNKKEKEEYIERLKILGLGLEHHLTQKVGLLSGGQRQALTLLMASLQKPKLLLLDEHTAALDPQTAKKVLEITRQIVSDNHLTAMMVTHNMKDAIATGNRLIMMHQGRIIYEVRDEEKKNITVDDLMRKFVEASGEEFSDDQSLLTK